MLFSQYCYYIPIFCYFKWRGKKPHIQSDCWRSHVSIENIQTQSWIVWNRRLLLTHVTRISPDSLLSLGNGRIRFQGFLGRPRVCHFLQCKQSKLNPPLTPPSSLVGDSTTPVIFPFFSFAAIHPSFLKTHSNFPSLQIWMKVKQPKIVLWNS